jgi:hypothetical protein
MKKYKVIKDFPQINSLYKIGDIIDGKGNKGLYALAENWPEYFEEIKSEYPKILSFRRKENGFIAYIWGNGMYDTDLFKKYSLDAMLYEGSSVDSGDWEIYQVQVSEDGEIFTVGDKVQDGCNIIEFKYDETYDCKIKAKITSSCYIVVTKLIKVKSIMKKTIDIDVPEGYELNSIQTNINKDIIPYICINLKKIEVKDWKWYIEEYFKVSNTNTKLANLLSFISDSYLETTKKHFLIKKVDSIWEYKIGLLKFICEDLGYDYIYILNLIKHENITRKQYKKLFDICPKEFLKSVL